MNFKKLLLMVFLSMLVLNACSDKDEEEIVDDPQTTTPTEPEEPEPSNDYYFTISDQGVPGDTKIGVAVSYTDGTFKSGPMIEATANDPQNPGVYKFNAVADEGKTIKDIMLLQPYNDNISMLDNGQKIGHLLYTIQEPSATGYDVKSNITAGCVEADSKGNMEVKLKSIVTPLKIMLSGIDAGEKLKAITMEATNDITGLATINFDKDLSKTAINGFDAGRACKMVTAIYPEGLEAISSDYEVKLFTGQSNNSSLVFRAITDKYVITETRNQDAIFTGNDELTIGFAFTENATREKAQTLNLSKDESTAATITVPDTEGNMVTRIICFIETASADALHSLWLEVFDGETWTKMEGTDKNMTQSQVDENGGYIELVVPELNISSSAKLRIAKENGSTHTSVKMITMVYEEEPVIEEPVNLIAEDAAWIKMGTASNAANNFDRDAVLVFDNSVSHIDDGSGSYRIGGLDCTNNFKPWNAWRLQKDIPAEAGTKYRISLWIKTVDMPANANVYLGFGFKDSSNVLFSGWIEGAENAKELNQKTSSWVDKQKGTHDWMELTAEITAPTGAAYFSYFQCKVDGVISAPTAYAWFDDVKIVKVQ